MSLGFAALARCSPEPAGLGPCDQFALSALRVYDSAMPSNSNARIRRLSADHRLALELARTIRERLERGVGPDAVASTLDPTSEQRLEEHFKIEETSLAITFAGEIELELVARTMSEHRAIRCLFTEVRGGSALALVKLADALEAHVRFEERDLYPAILARLEPI